MSNNLILYHLDLSPPVRAVKVVAKLLGIELELRELDLLGGEHLKEPFVKVNPEHTIPTLVDNGFVIWDSHAICAYLVDKYGNDDTLYPKDLQLRAKCHQRMIFNAASLFVRLRDIGIPIYFKGAPEIPQPPVDAVKESLNILDAFLANDPFLVGKNLTIADICTAVTVQFVEVYVPLQADKHANILAWLKRVSQTIPFFEQMNGQKKEQYHALVKTTLEKNQRKK